MQWYQKQFRRNLVDMHIEDWSPEFLSKFSPEQYVENLKIGKIGAPMLYFQSHVGLCYWPTKTGKMHNGFVGREDLMKRVEQLCHKNGMDVIGYYSLIYNNWAHENHPEWRMIDASGKHSRENGNRYGLCCPNNMEYRAFTRQQIQELSEYFDFEGIFYDMLFWPMICYCDACQARWKKEVGGEMPKIVDWKDERWKLFQQKRTEWMGEYAQWVTAVQHEFKPGVAIEHQYSTQMHDWRFGINENMALASTYSGGDLYGGIEEQSFACKMCYGCTQNQPFEYMTSRCYPSLSEHTTTKSLDLLRMSVMMTYVHHGACLLIDAIDPTGTMDRRVYERIGQVFSETQGYERVLTWGKQAFDVALYYDLNGKYNPEAEPSAADDDAHMDRTKPMQEALMGAARSLRAHHIPYTAVNNCFFDRYREGKVLVLSDVPAFEDSKVDSVLEFVKNGGSLYMSGHCHPRLLQEIFGLEYTGMTDEQVTYVSPTPAGDRFMDGQFTHQYPLVMFERQFLAEGTPKGEVLGTLTLPYTIPNRSSASATPFFATGDAEADKDKLERTRRFASIHSNPPGIFTERPAMVLAQYGKGKAIWSASPIERPNREQHSEIFAKMISMLADNQFCFAAQAPESVECVLFDAPEHNAKVMGIINLQEAFHTPEVHDITVSVACEKQPSAVTLLPENTPMKYTWQNGMVSVHLDSLKCCAMYTIEF
ncbi:MAG: alpha-L-fucosidase [Eubacteriales bacterium]|nr:alpha-L-fucosidase [Eubacteriales bacterium]